MFFVDVDVDVHVDVDVDVDGFSLARQAATKQKHTAEARRTQRFFFSHSSRDCIASDFGTSSSPSASRLMPSRNSGTWKLISSPSAQRVTLDQLNKLAA